MRRSLEWRNRQNQYARVARDAARAIGFCTTCRKLPAEIGKCRCSACNQARRYVPQVAP